MVPDGKGGDFGQYLAGFESSSGWFLVLYDGGDEYTGPQAKMTGIVLNPDDAQSSWKIYTHVAEFSV